MKKLTYSPLNHSASRTLNFIVEGFSIELVKNQPQEVSEENLQKLKESSQFKAYTEDKTIRVEDSESSQQPEKKMTTKTTKIE